MGLSDIFLAVKSLLTARSIYYDNFLTDGILAYGGRKPFSNDTQVLSGLVALLEGTVFSDWYEGNPRMPLSEEKKGRQSHAPQAKRRALPWKGGESLSPSRLVLLSLMASLGRYSDT